MFEYIEISVSLVETAVDVYYTLSVTYIIVRYCITNLQKFDF